MKIVIGADHRGFKLKERLKSYLERIGVEVEDVGAHRFDAQDDFPDFAGAVARKVAAEGVQGRGILLCGSGVGVDIAANKIPKIRSALVFNKEVARQAMQHEDANIISIPADWVGEKEAEEMVSAWIGEKFLEDEKYKRRLKKIEEMEK